MEKQDQTVSFRQPTLKKRKTFINNKSTYLIGLIILLSLLSIFFFVKYQQVKNNNTNPDKEVAQVVNKVSAIIQLPDDETPTLATVVDVTKFEGQPFFSGAKNGDKVLVYAENQQAIIYRPSTNKIINVGPISINANDKNPAQENTPKIPSVDIIARENDSNATTARINGDYEGKVATSQVSSDDPIEKTIIVVNNQEHADLAKQIADTLKASVDQAPQNYKESKADIVIYVKS